MIDRIYQEAQAMLNKTQMGYLTPMQYNLFINSAVEEMYFWIIEQYRKAIRRSNWLLDGKELADYKKYYEEMLDYYTKKLPLVESSVTPSTVEAVFSIPTDYRHFRNLVKNKDGTQVDKVGIKEFNLLKRNIYSPPTKSNVYCTRVGNNIIVIPLVWYDDKADKLDLYYLKKPTQAIWAYTILLGKATYSSTNSTPVDAPDVLYDELLLRVLKKAGLTIRDKDTINYVNVSESQKQQQENTQ